MIYAAIRLDRGGGASPHGAFRRSETALALGTTVAVLLLGVLYGVLVAVALSIVDLLRRVARPHDGILGYVPGLAGMHDVDDYADARQSPGWSSTATTRRCASPTPMTSAARAGLGGPTTQDPVEWFVLNAEANVEIDMHGRWTRSSSCGQDLAGRGIVFALARVKQDLRDALARRG